MKEFPTVVLPFKQASQRFIYLNDIGHHSVSTGLRIDIREFLNTYCVGGQGGFHKDPPKNGWNYTLDNDGIKFTFDHSLKSVALYFKIKWSGKQSIYEDEPVPRPDW